MLLALSSTRASSHRGVKLHTFERDEDRGYTSTPTKIGGHHLDHVRNGFTVWGGNTASDGQGKPVRHTDSLFDSKSRFGGLGRGDVFIHMMGRGSSFGRRPQSRTFAPSPTVTLRPRNMQALFPLYSTPADFPPDTVAWQQHVEHGPHRRLERTDESRSIVRNTPPSSAVQHHNANGASRHTGALMAVLLSKLANSSNGSTHVDVVQDSSPLADTDTTPEATHEELDEVRSPAQLMQSVEAISLVHRGAIDHTRQNSTTSGTGVSVSSQHAAAVNTRSNNEAWAWNCRIQQAPSHSKLRRYNFVRRLGGGSQGTILLVRKKTSGKIRVLKESSFLSEAINEARLLLLAGTAETGKSELDAAGTSRARTVVATDDRSSPENQETSRRGFDDGPGWGGKKAWLQHSVAGNTGAGVHSQRTNEWKISGASVVDTSGGSGSGGERYERGGVVQLHDFFVETLGHNSLAFLELDYCDGGDLHDLIVADGARSENTGVGRCSSKPSAVGISGREGGRAPGGARMGLPAEQVAKVALGLCEGLQCLHERGVLHRDLKPGNVLFTKSGAVRIADLGVSTSLQPSRPLTEHAAGTIPFMAPEVRKFLLGSKVHYCGKADVWAIGALVYAMTVGDPAPAELTTASRAELVSAVGHRTGCEELAMVAHKALNPDPDRRPSVHQVASMLEECCRKQGWPLKSHKTLSRSGARPTARVPAAGLARL